MCIIRLKAASKGLSNKQGDAQKSDVSYRCVDMRADTRQACATHRRKALVEAVLTY